MDGLSESERVSDSGGKTTAAGLNRVVGRAGSTSQRARLLWVLLVIVLIGAKTNWVGFRVLVRTSSVHDK